MEICRIDYRFHLQRLNETTLLLVMQQSDLHSNMQDSGRSEIMTLEDPEQQHNVSRQPRKKHGFSYMGAQ